MYTVCVMLMMHHVANTHTQTLSRVRPVREKSVKLTLISAIILWTPPWLNCANILGTDTRRACDTCARRGRTLSTLRSWCAQLGSGPGREYHITAYNYIITCDVNDGGRSRTQDVARDALSSRFLSCQGDTL